MNKLELLALMRKHGDTQEKLAEALGLSRTRLNAKINERDRAAFTQPEILAIKNRYALSAEGVEEIFFAKPVSL